MQKVFKSLFIASALSFGVSAYSQSQGFMIHDNGTVSTLSRLQSSNALSTFFKTPHFFGDYNLKDYSSQYVIDKKGIVFTLSEDGYLFEKKFPEYKGKPSLLGGRFFMTSRGELVVVSNKGFLITFPSKEIKFSSPKILGDNFFITKKGELLTITSEGALVDKTSTFSVKPDEVLLSGGNYFITKAGELVTIGEDAGLMYVYTAQIRYVVEDFNGKESIPSVGKNYFFDNKNNIHTISLKGQVDLGGFSRQILVEDRGGKQYDMQPKVIGSSYFSFGDDILFQVGDDGFYYEVGRSDRKIRLSNIKGE